MRVGDCIRQHDVMYWEVKLRLVAFTTGLYALVIAMKGAFAPAFVAM